MDYGTDHAMGYEDMSRLGNGCARGSAAALLHVCICAPVSAPALSIINGHAADMLKLPGTEYGD